MQQRYANFTLRHPHYHKKSSIILIYNWLQRKCFFAVKVRKNDKWIILGDVSAKEAALIKEKTGLDVKGFSRMMDISSIRHIRRRHTNLYDTDFCLIPLILSSYDIVEKGDEEGSIKYIKEFEKLYIYIEYVRKGRKRLSLKTFMKIRKPH